MSANSSIYFQTKEVGRIYLQNKELLHGYLKNGIYANNSHSSSSVKEVSFLHTGNCICTRYCCEVGRYHHLHVTGAETKAVSRSVTSEQRRGLRLEEGLSFVRAPSWSRWACPSYLSAVSPECLLEPAAWCLLTSKMAAMRLMGGWVCEWRKAMGNQTYLPRLH